MQSHYSINVAQASEKEPTRFMHYLKITLDAYSEAHARTLLADVKTRFPETERFKVDMTYWQGRGYPVE